MAAPPHPPQRGLLCLPAPHHNPLLWSPPPPTPWNRCSPQPHIQTRTPLECAAGEWAGPPVAPRPAPFRASPPRPSSQCAGRHPHRGCVSAPRHPHRQARLGSFPPCEWPSAWRHNHPQVLGVCASRSVTSLSLPVGSTFGGLPGWHGVHLRMSCLRAWSRGCDSEVSGFQGLSSRRETFIRGFMF